VCHGLVERLEIFERGLGFVWVVVVDVGRAAGGRAPDVGLLLAQLPGEVSRSNGWASGCEERGVRNAEWRKGPVHGDQLGLPGA